MRAQFIRDLEKRFGPATRLPRSQSLYELGNGMCRVYVRYSKLHPRLDTFFGLRFEDLRRLEGHQAFIALLWDGQEQPLLLPYSEFEDVFAELEPAADGQFKVQVYPRDDAAICYVARAGRFNVEGHFGWTGLEDALKGVHARPTLSHGQVQTLLGAIGVAKDYDVWIPASDRASLDWSITSEYALADNLPPSFDSVRRILREIDVVWLRPGGVGLAAVYEVEHSTPIYSGLLRLNDVRLVNPNIDRLTVVSNEPRRAAFVRQLNRPTFQASSLTRTCTFLEYSEVYDWHQRLVDLS